MAFLKIKTRWFPALMNLIGLGIAFSIFLILLSQVWWDFRYDRFEGGKDVYLVEIPSPMHEDLYFDRVLRPLIPMIADCTPDIEVACDYFAFRNDQLGRFEYKNVQGEWVKYYGANYANTETAVLDVFNVTLLEGRREDFAQAGDVLIAESTAKMLFPDRNPVGEIIRDLGRIEYRITGIYRDRKENETLINGFLMHEGEKDMSLPNSGSHSGYIKLAPGADLAAVREAVGKVQYLEIPKGGCRITQIHDVWFEKDKETFGYDRGGNKTLCLILLSIAVLFLLIAGFNYVNFAMAAIPFRIRDINTRKVFGASRWALILRQMIQALILVGAAYLIGVVAMKTVSGTQWGTYLSWNMTPEKNTAVICIGAAAALVLAILSGLAPALYSTSFQPALVLKGSFALSAKGGGLRMATMVLQYVLSFIFLICGMLLQRQTSYMVNNNELGFDHDYVLRMSSHLYMKVADVMAEIKNIPGVVDVTRGDSPMVEGMSSTTEIRDGDRVVQISFRDEFPEYPGFFRLQLVDGRLPLPGEENVALINESFREAAPSFGLGTEIQNMYGDKCPVIGILKDFHARTLENDYYPLAIFIRENSNAASFMIRIEPNADAATILEKARDIYTSLKPMIDKEGIETGFLNEDLEKLYEQETRQTRLIRLSSILSLIITLIGILGVVWLDVRFMRKEIALRKVNGASRRDILSRIGWKYLLTAAVGFIIAAPIAYAICRRWLEQFAFRTTIPVWLFALAFVIVICITLVTVILQAWSAANANPVDAIKNE